MEILLYYIRDRLIDFFENHYSKSTYKPKDIIKFFRDDAINRLVFEKVLFTSGGNAVGLTTDNVASFAILDKSTPTTMVIHVNHYYMDNNNSIRVTSNICDKTINISLKYDNKKNDHNGITSSIITGDSRYKITAACKSLVNKHLQHTRIFS